MDVGTACMNFHNEMVKEVKSKRIQADEIWAFVNSKEKNTTAEMKEKGNGDAWTWVALDADTKYEASDYFAVDTPDYNNAETLLKDAIKMSYERFRIKFDELKLPHGLKKFHLRELESHEIQAVYLDIIKKLRA